MPLLALGLLFAGQAQAVQCSSTITANVVVIENPTVFNRLGAQNPIGLPMRCGTTRGGPAQSAGAHRRPVGGRLAHHYKLRPPKPLVMRFNTVDCGKILHADLVPAEFELDDFQVRTPTDIIGPHIHLPKWDLTTDDGEANGWNYEDGTLSPGIVGERIHAINNFNALADTSNLLTALLTQLGIEVNPILAEAVANHQLNLTDLAAVPTIDTGDPGSDVLPGLTELTALPHPFFGTGVGDERIRPERRRA